MQLHHHGSSSGQYQRNPPEKGIDRHSLPEFHAQVEVGTEVYSGQWKDWQQLRFQQENGKALDDHSLGHGLQPPYHHQNRYLEKPDGWMTFSSTGLGCKERLTPWSR